MVLISRVQRNKNTPGCDHWFKNYAAFFHQRKKRTALTWFMPVLAQPFDPADTHNEVILVLTRLDSGNEVTFAI
ncbi:MAG: hypothetical protein AB3N11_05375, partial [Arenibacterium sp.]